MRFCRVGRPGSEIPAIIDAAGTLRDFSAQTKDVDGELLQRHLSGEFDELDLSALPVIGGVERFGSCVAKPSKIVGVGMNYRDHARQAGVDMPARPTLFTKPTTTLSGPDDPVALPAAAQHADWEVELAVVVGKRATRLSPGEGFAHVGGYCIANDVTEREWIRLSGQLLDGKGLDTFTPLGPYLATPDEITDPARLGLSLSLDGEPRQQSTTAELIFGIAFLIEHISHLMTLLPGDVILTGTPAGVGARASPPRCLRDGDRLRLEIDGLGRQNQIVMVEAAP